ncbi:hypothetical protein [Methanopyrus sp.]
MITTLTVLAIGISGHRTQEYASLAVLGSLSFLTGLGVVKLPRKYAVPLLLTALGVLFLKVHVPNLSVLMTYLIGSLPGAVLVYIYPQLLTFRRDLEALLVTSAVPVTELLVWKYFGEGFLPMGYLTGPCWLWGSP